MSELKQNLAALNKLVAEGLAAGIKVQVVSSADELVNLIATAIKEDKRPVSDHKATKSDIERLGEASERACVNVHLTSTKYRDCPPADKDATKKSLVKHTNDLIRAFADYEAKADQLGVRKDDLTRHKIRKSYSDAMAYSIQCRAPGINGCDEKAVANMIEDFAPDSDLIKMFKETHL